MKIISEFNSRIDAQRSALKIINEYCIYEEPLFSLSGKAIDRWIVNNRINPKNDIVLNIIMVSEKLFFLANKSQEQITEDYKSLSTEVSEIIKLLQVQMRDKALQLTIV